MASPRYSRLRGGGLLRSEGTRLLVLAEGRWVEDPFLSCGAIEGAIPLTEAEIAILMAEGILPQEQADGLGDIATQVASADSPGSDECTIWQLPDDRLVKAEPGAGLLVAENGVWVPVGAAKSGDFTTDALFESEMLTSDEIATLKAAGLFPRQPVNLHTGRMFPLRDLDVPDKGEDVASGKEPPEPDEPWIVWSCDGQFLKQDPMGAILVIGDGSWVDTTDMTLDVDFDYGTKLTRREIAALMADGTLPAEELGNRSEECIGQPRIPRTGSVAIEPLQTEDQKRSQYCSFDHRPTGPYQVVLADRFYPQERAGRIQLSTCWDLDEAIVAAIEATQESRKRYETFDEWLYRGERGLVYDQDRLLVFRAGEEYEEKAPMEPLELFEHAERDLRAADLCLEDAIALAATAHRGQVDKGKQPYILHPLRVMMAVKSRNERMAAVLHDVIEDTNVTMDDLRKDGYPQEVLEALDCLTRRQGERYKDFIERAAVNPIARAVKLADLADNMDPSRLRNITDKGLGLLARYQAAQTRLAGVIK